MLHRAGRLLLAEGVAERVERLTEASVLEGL
jgi:hypothetical protein